MAAAVQQLAECRRAAGSVAGVDTAARLEAAIKVLGGMPPAPPRELALYALATSADCVGGPPCLGSVAGVKPGAAPGVPTR